MNKKNRILEIFYRAFKGEKISIKELAQQYHVSIKSISRDIAEIKNFLADNRSLVGNSELVYDYCCRTYSLRLEDFIVSKELIAIVKVLLASRAFSKLELLNIISKLKRLTTNEDRELLNTIIQNEMYHYQDVYHDNPSVIDTMWRIVTIIDKHKEITITYIKQDRTYVERKIQPVAILFSEFYFYVLAYREGITKPYYFRIDRIMKIVEHRTSFHIEQPFDEGELKQQIQYMYPGVYRKIKFEFTGPSLHAILDKLPTAKVIDRQQHKVTIEALVYGKGITMFLLSQGEWIKVLEPKEYVEEITKKIDSMRGNYV